MVTTRSGRRTSLAPACAYQAYRGRMGDAMRRVKSTVGDRHPSSALVKTYRASVIGYSHTQAAIDAFVRLLTQVRSQRRLTEDLRSQTVAYIDNMMSSSSVATSLAGRVITRVANNVAGLFIGNVFSDQAYMHTDFLHKLFTTTPQILCYHNLLILLCYAKHVKFKDINALQQFVYFQSKRLRADLKSWFKPPVSFGKNTYAARFQMPTYESMLKNFSNKTTQVQMPMRVSYVNSSKSEALLLDFLIKQEPERKLVGNFTYTLA